MAEPKMCAKAYHDQRGGYLHAADDDRPYDVDGVSYCGRCHGPAHASHPAAAPLSMEGTTAGPWKVEHRGPLWRVVNGTRVWGANKDCTEAEASTVASALNARAASDQGER